MTEFRDLVSKGPHGALSTSAVHICVVRLATVATGESDFRTILSTEELAKADRFHFQKDRFSYTLTRGILRCLLSGVVGKPPRQLQIVSNKFGKPALSTHQNAGQFEFNVSHSAEYSLIAIGREARVGIDIEKMKPNLEFRRLAKSILSQDQYSQFLSMPCHLQPDSFYRCWTRKEAFSKAVGLGLSLPYDSFDVSFLPGELPTVLRHNPTIAGDSPWSLHTLDVGHGYAGALAVEMNSPSLVVWEWG